jgi:hypothetical protein
VAEPREWESFYVMAGGAAAVLTGLIFVAVTLHKSIVDTVLHRDRAWASIALLLSQLLISMAVLVPEQDLRLLGIEVGLVAAFWLYRTARVIRVLGPAMRRADRPNARWQLEWVTWFGWLVALVAAPIAFLAQSLIGFPLLAIAMAGMFGFAVWSAWVLVSEVMD